MKEWFVEIRYNFFSGGFETLTFKPFATSREDAIAQAKDATFAMYGTFDGTMEVVFVEDCSEV